MDRASAARELFELALTTNATAAALVPTEPTVAAALSGDALTTGHMPSTLLGPDAVLAFGQPPEAAKTTDAAPLARPDRDAASQPVRFTPSPAPAPQTAAPAVVPFVPTPLDRLAPRDGTRRGPSQDAEDDERRRRIARRFSSHDDDDGVR